MRISLLLFSLCLTACTVAPEPSATSATQVPEKAPNTEMRDAIQAPIEKAKKVEDQVLDGADQQRADIEAAGG